MSAATTKSSAGDVRLFLGPEVGDKRAEIARLLKETQKRDAGADVYSYYPYDTEIETILATLDNPSLFSGSRFVVINSIEEFKKPDLTALIAYIQKPSPDVRLILVSDQTSVLKIDKRLGEIIPKSAQKVFWELFENEKERRIRSYLKADNLEISDEAISRLLELVDNNTSELRTSCEALSYDAGKRGVEYVEEEDVDRLISHGKEESVFSLFDRLAKKDLAGATETLSRLQLGSDGIGVQTIGGLIGQARRLLAYKEALEDGAAPDTAALNLGITNARGKALYREAERRYSLKEIRDMITLASRCDMALRSIGKEAHRVILDFFLMECCRSELNLNKIFVTL